MYELKIIQNYALALFANSKSIESKDKVFSQISQVEQLMIASQELNYFMCLPINSHANKNKLIEIIAQKLKLKKLVTRFFVILIKNARFNLLSEIVKEYGKLLAESKGIEEVRIFSAQKLAKKEVNIIQKYLQEELEKIIEITADIDESLIGGIIIQYGSKLIDASVAGSINHIEKIAKQVKL